MKLPQTFSQQAKQFIESCCMQRLMLLRTGKSQIKDDNIYNLTTGLWNEIQPLCSDQQIALFLKKKEDDLKALIPGKKCKGIEKRLQKFNELIFQSEQILKKWLDNDKK